MSTTQADALEGEGVPTAEDGALCSDTKIVCDVQRGNSTRPRAAFFMNP
jgi:hypothetical protein